MHAQFSRIHRAAYPVRRRPCADACAVSISTGHAPIVRTHMRSALQSLGVTDHAHEAKTLHCPCVDPDNLELVMMNFECLSAWSSVGPRSWYNHKFRGIRMPEYHHIASTFHVHGLASPPFFYLQSYAFSDQLGIVYRLCIICYSLLEYPARE